MGHTIHADMRSSRPSPAAPVASPPIVAVSPIQRAQADSPGQLGHDLNTVAPRNHLASLGWLSSATLHLVVALVFSVAIAEADRARRAPHPLKLMAQVDEPPRDNLEDLGRLTLVIDDVIAAESHLPLEPAIPTTALLTHVPPPQLARPTPAAENMSPRGEFFGAVAYGDRFIYILDNSTSMSDNGDPVTGVTRFARAIAELERSVGRLRIDQQFYVILFCYETRLMFDEHSYLPQLMPATAENKRRLTKWLASSRTGPGTDPRAALQIALQMRPQAIFLLSDGDFNGQRVRRQGLRGNPTVRQIVREGRGVDIPIHTFALEDAVGSRRLAAISAETGGEFRMIPGGQQPRRPPGAKLSSAERSRKRQQILARSWLRTAIQYDQQGKRRVAIRRYRAIAEAFPSTAAAQEARQRLNDP